MSLILTTLRQNELANMAISEIAGLNVPRYAMGRTPEERLDVAVNEAGNLFGFFGMALTLDRAFDKLLKKPFQTGGSAAQWARAGKSLAILSMLFSVLYSVPFFRNWVTAKKTHQVSFRSVIDQQAPFRSEHATEDLLEKQERSFLFRGARALGVGALLATAFTMVARWGIVKQVPWERVSLPVSQSVLTKLKQGEQALSRLVKRHGEDPLKASIVARSLSHKRLLLGDILNRFIGFGQHSKTQQYSVTRMPWLSQLLFWGTPSYIGYYNASRGKTEKRETLVKTANFMVSFFFLPHVTQFLGPKMVQWLKLGGKNPALMKENAKSIVNLLSKITALAVSTVYYQKQTEQILQPQQNLFANFDMAQLEQPRQTNGVPHWGVQWSPTPSVFETYHRELEKKPPSLPLVSGAIGTGE